MRANQLKHRLKQNQERLLWLLLLAVTCGLLAGCSLWPFSQADTSGLYQTISDDATVLYTPTDDVVYPETINPVTIEDSEECPETSEALNEADEEVVTITTGGFAVSSSNAQATYVGMSILADGGNAVDAAVAMAFTLGVCEPNSSGLGGSGMMLVYDTNTDTAYFLDYYGSAGSADTMTDEVAIPGLLKGMETALELWGTLTLAEAMAPAIEYAEEGFTATSYFVNRLNYSSSLRNNSAFSSVSVGDTVVQTKLASTMKTIAQQGTDVFYSGSIAQDIAAKCSLTVEDLTSYEVYLSEPLESSFMGYRILTGNAPSSGMTVAQILSISEALSIPSSLTDLSSYLSVLQRSTLLAYSQRSSLLVDPRYYDFDGSTYVSEAYIQSLLDTSVSSYTDDNELYCTTQFSVIDNNGLIVCVTNTLSDNWGSYTLVDGFYLNNTLSNFGTSGKNAYEPGKRPRTHFAPTIVVGDNGYTLAIGSPGGVNIPRIVAGVLIDILQNGTEVQTAVDRIRAFYDSDGALCIETNDDGRDSAIVASKIPTSYYYSSSHIYFGCTSIVGYDPSGGVFAAADRRRNTSQAMYYVYE